MDRISCDCCIVGGGPAGMVLATLLARANVHVVVLEKQSYFLRDFRVPQWDFLDVVVEEARRFAGFELRMQHDVFELLHEAGRITGVRAAAPSGEVEVEAKLVVACDGQRGAMREAAGLFADDLGAPMDVLYFRLPRKTGDPEESFGVAERGRLLVSINRREYWQIAYVIPKGCAATLQCEPIGAFRTDLARRLPLFAERVSALIDWNAVKLLDARVDRLRRWHKPGLLVIGDAAHAMSPIGGVGINLAIRDAVTAANWIRAPLARGEAPRSWRLAAVQWRRRIPTDLVQSVQRLLQRVLIAPALAASGDPSPVRIPQALRIALRFADVRALPARQFGVGRLEPGRA